MLIEIHMLKNYPPVNLNRDDSGAPKMCYFGGTQRGRISSQCLKRSWRTSEQFAALGSVGIRTRKMPEIVAQRLREMGIAEGYIEHAASMLTGIANKEGKENSKGNYTEQIVLYAPEDIDALVNSVAEAIKADGSEKVFKKRKAKEFATCIADADKRAVSADIALFGRMVTTDCLRDVDASIQVAHAISTHAVNRESDYFTAVDDLVTGEETGAGMMGDVDYNSCCYYEYASLDVDKLKENLRFSENNEQLVEQLIPTLLQVMTMSNPTGKQNTFAGQVLPSMILIECKAAKIPLSYVNAYEEAVPTYGSAKVVKSSIERLVAEVNAMDSAYALPVKHRIWLAPKYDGSVPETGERVQSFADMKQAVTQWVREDA